MKSETIIYKIADLARDAGKNDDKALQAALLAVCALASCPFSKRTEFLVSLAHVGCDFVTAAEKLDSK